MKTLLILATSLLALSCKQREFNTNSEVDYAKGSIGSSSIDYTKPTFILVVGDVGTGSGSLGTLPADSALARAYRYKAAFGDKRQVVMFMGNTSGGVASIAKKSGMKVVEQTSAQLSKNLLFTEIAKFSKINSIETFSHASAPKGIYLDEGSEYRFKANAAELVKLKGRFTNDAFVILHGCNTGWGMAAQLSALWNVPVAGALGAANFQKLHQDGNFYLNDEGFYPNKNWAKTNAYNFDSPMSCSTGACARFRPEPNLYHGVFGSTTHGLGFYKFFCNFEGAEQCHRGIATSVYGWIVTPRKQTTTSPEGTVSTTLAPVNLKHVQPSRAEYEAAVQDILCQTDGKMEVRRNTCLAILNGTQATAEDKELYNGSGAQCDLKECLPKLKCTESSSSSAGWVCKNDSSVSVKGKYAQTLKQEYALYKAAFGVLYPGQ